MWYGPNAEVRWRQPLRLVALLACAALVACGGGGSTVGDGAPASGGGAGGGASSGSGGGSGGEPVETSTDSLLSSGGAEAAQTEQVLVRLVNEQAAQQFSERAAEYDRVLSAHTGLALRSIRQTASGSVVMALPKAMGPADVEEVVQRLKSSSAVAYAEPDSRVWSDAMAAPNDERWGDQWNLASATGTGAAASGVQVQAAWTLTMGSASTVVAVLDSGVLPHADLQARLLPGYDFVSNFNYGNDGNGRDPDATDPGDWVDGSEDWLQGSSTRNSAWHGTHVAGIIAAQRGNAVGISGIDARARVLPVRVLGRGGGYMSDVADGLLWAVGAPVPGVPANPTPARVANLSLGGTGRCSREVQNALDEAWARGVVVVASAGNLSQNVSSTVLASCARVVVTASVGRGGEQASYSNFGEGVTLSAPGGNAASDTGVLSLGDGGQQKPALDNTYRRKRGTSMAAPHVAGTAALMLAANPGLSPAQVVALLRASARPFSKGTTKDCTPALCGVGVLDTAGAVSLAALYPAHRPVSTAGVGSESAVATLPQAGWWRDVSDPTRQAFVDVRGPEVLLSVQYRSAAGAPGWAHARLAASAEGDFFAGQAVAFSGGGTLAGATRAPQPTTDLGVYRWHTVDGTSARLVTPAGEWRLARDAFGGGAPSDGRTGSWWSPDRPGLVFLLEQQGNFMRVGVHAFADNGSPQWYVVQLSRGVDGAYRGQWQQASPTLPHKLVPASAIDSEWVWLSALEGRLRLPNGRHIALSASVSGDVAEARAQSASLLGIWRASYVVGRNFSERWTLAHLRPSEVNAGDFNVWGLNEWGGTMVGGWSSRYANHSLYAPGLAFDDFYRFHFDDEGLKGCYHHYHIALSTLSACYPFTAEQQGVASEALAAVPAIVTSATGDRSKEAMLQAALAPRALSTPVPTVLSLKSEVAPNDALTQLRHWQQQVVGAAR